MVKAQEAQPHMPVAVAVSIGDAVVVRDKQGLVQAQRTF